uniref:Mitochondrial ribosomal protein L55 n=2 Tax=Malurus TaxID=55806 RepID=A0A8C5U5J5_9PASS
MAGQGKQGRTIVGGATRGGAEHGGGRGSHRGAKRWQDSVLRLPATSRPPLAACVRSNSNRAAISHLHRQLYGRLYPVLLVNTDGSTVRLRYSEPKRILMLPLDSSTLPEAERKARLRRHFPSKPKAKEEETFEGIDLDTYKKFWKK